MMTAPAIQAWFTVINMMEDEDSQVSCCLHFVVVNLVSSGFRFPRSTVGCVCYTQLPTGLHGLIVILCCLCRR